MGKFVTAAVFCSMYCIISSCAIQGVESKHIEAKPSKADDPVTVRRTVLVHEDGTREDLGPRPYARSADRLMNLFPMSGVALDDSGHVIAFALAAPPVPGVQVPPLDTPLEFIRVNGHGQLVDWQVAAEAANELPAFKLRTTVGPGGEIFYSRANFSCDQPNVCLLPYVYDENGTLIEIRCDCDALP